MVKIICNLILLCFVPRLYAPSNIYEEKVAELANGFATEYAESVNNFEKAYHSWIEVKNTYHDNQSTWFDGETKIS